MRKPARRRQAEFEFLELRTFLSAGWDITLIDSTVGNQAVLRRALVPGGRVILYNGKTDSAADVLTRITDWAQETGSKIKSISLLSEGAPGRFELGNQWISNSTLLQTAPDWERLSNVLTNDAVIKLYGCDLADPLGAGQRLIDRVASVTGAEVFATTNLIGRSGDWAFDAAVKQLNPLQSSSLIAFPSPTNNIGSSAAALETSRASVNRASLAITPGGAKSVNRITQPRASGVANYSVPKPKAIEAPAVGTIAGWTNRTEPTEDVVLLDTQVPDATALEKAVLPGTNLITYDGATETADDVLSRVIDWAQTNDVRIGSLSLLSHGNTGAFELGDQWITSTVLAQTAMEWRKLGDVLAPNASIDIFGCDVAAPGGDGQFLIDKIAKLTGAAVFASTNLTGRGGDWNLEAGSNGEALSSTATSSFPMNAAVLTTYPDSLLFTISTPAAASPSPVTGTTTALSVAALDILGTGTLTYTWSTTGTPPAAVTYSANGTATSNDVTATFTKAGTYSFKVTMVDGGDTSTSTVNVTVDQTATAITVSPGTAALNENQTQQFTATEFDQFGNAMATQPTFTWAKASGVGSISSTGLYTAPYGTGSASITATSGSLSGSASITVTNAAPTVAMAASATPNPVTGTSATLSVLGADDGGESNLTYYWVITSGPSYTVWSSTNGANSSKNFPVTFSGAGTYHFKCTISDAQGASVTSSVSVTVEQTLKEIVVLPSLVSVPKGTTQQCTAVAYDQFGNAMATQPTFTWSVSGGGSINQSGLYTAPSVSGDYPIIKATSGSYIGLSQFITVANSAAVVPPGNDTGTNSSVNVAGYSSSYIYTWSVISKPSGATTPTFSANASSSADATVVTFYQAGLYEYVCNFGNADGSGTQYCATFETTVEQTPTSLAITPTSATLPEAGTQQFSASVDDQFGNALSSQPAFTWSVSSGAGSVTSGGLYTAANSFGTATVKASSGSLSATASITVSAAADTVPGAQTTVENVPLTFSSQDNNLMAVGSTTNVTGLSVSSGTLALATTSGLTFFNGTSNDSDMIEVSGTAAAINAALNGLVYTPNNGFSGSDPLDFVTGVAATGQATTFTDNSVPITVSPTPPTVATPAAANPSTVTGTSTALTVQGADDGGASNLTYTWQTTGNPPAAVTFSANGSNAANDTTATFTVAGTYHFTVTITNAAGLSTTSSVSVVVQQQLTTIAVSPASAALNENQTQQFTASAFDQFGNAMASQPTFAWSIGSGVGSISGSGLYTAPAGAGSASVVATSGSISGLASVTVTNAPPTVAMAATANPGTVTGTSTALSVLGADDGGEANLTYSWSVLSEPNGATHPSFSANGSNAAKNTTAVFSQAGTYELEATITDAGGLSTTSSVSVTVDQTFTSIAVSPANSSVAAGGTEQFSASALDQFGLSMAQQPSFSWSATDGMISSTGAYTAPPVAGPVTISASDGNTSGSTTVTIVGNNTAVASPSTVTGNSTTLSVNGGATSGVTYTWSVLHKPSGAASPTFSINGSGAAQTTTATFFAAGEYTFQVAIDSGSTTTQSVDVTVDQTLSTIQVTPATSNLNENGKQTFSAVGFDQFGHALATQPSFSWDVSSGGGTIDGNGHYTAAGSNGAGSATIAAVAESPNGSVSGSANITVTNAAPTIATAAAASPSAVSGTTSHLSVLGADDGGESNLTYTWSTVGTPPAPVTFSANGSNDAKNTTATFTEAGDYQFLVTVKDAEGLSTTSSVRLTVDQTLTQLVLSPGSATVAEGHSQQFSASATDQFGNAMPDPSLLWSVRSGTGYISSSGLFTAASSPGITTISASNGNVRASATITVPNEAPTVASAAKSSPNLVTGTSTALSVLGADDGGESNLTYTWSTYGTSPAAVTFSANSSNAAKSTTAHFSKAGDYQFLVTITDAQGLSTTSTTSVTVNQTLTHLAVSPATSTVAKDGTEQFSAAATDQFGHPMTAPTLTWSVRSGVGTIDGSGLFTAGTVPGTVTIAGASGSVSGIATITIPNDPPTVATAASASPSPVTGTTTTLSVLGADDGGEANLTYTWSTFGTPPASVLFSTNGANGAKNTTATFSAPGDYQFLVTITDAEGATASSNVDVVVVPTLASVKVTSSEPSVERGQTVQFAATALDQFGTPLASQPTFSWSTDGNVGSIDASGNYTAPIAGTGTVNATARTGGVRGTASISLINRLAITAPASASTTPGVSFVFDQSSAITISDGDPQTVGVPVSITISATHGTVSLKDTSGLTFSSGAGTESALMTFTGTISDINNAIHGMSYTPGAGFSGMASVMVAINEVGTGTQTPSSPILIDVAAAAVAPSSGTSASGSASNASSSLGDEPDSTPTTPTQTTNPTSNASSTAQTSDTSSGAVDGTPSPGGSTARATPAPAPAKPADNTQKPAQQPSQQPVNANGNPAPAVAMPNLAAAVPDVRVESVPEQVFPFLSAKSEMSKELETETDRIVSEKKVRIVAGSATVASFGASAAYVLWMLRGGSLLSSLLSILPAWQSIDPLPVLDNFESKKRRKNRMNSDGESLESMVDKSNSDAEKDERVQEQA